MERDTYSCKSKIRKLLRGMKKETNESIQLKTVSDKTWANFVEDLYRYIEKQEAEE